MEEFKVNNLFPICLKFYKVLPKLKTENIDFYFKQNLVNGWDINNNSHLQILAQQVKLFMPNHILTNMAL